MTGQAGTFSQKRAAPLLRGLYERCAFGVALAVFGVGGLICTAVGPILYVLLPRRIGSALGENCTTEMQSEGLSKEEEKRWQENRAGISKRIMDSDMAEVFEFKAPEGPAPKKARILASLTCESCGEPVMETRTRRFNDQVLCIPCFEALEKR